MTDAIDIIYEDNHLLGVCKPAGLLVQGDRTGDPTAIELAKAYVKETYGKPGRVFLGLVHRIDRPVSGVVLFARTSKAASRLARAFHDRRVEKAYLAVVAGSVAQNSGEMVGYVERTERGSRLVREPSRLAKEARSSYRVLSRRSRTTLLEVTPYTGRHHQIRVQLSGAGHPVVGDVKYGAPEPLPDASVALHSARLSLDHPVGGARVTLVASPPLERAPWRTHRATIEGHFAPGE
jgi:23S rRNA pseudouridine1911/1915/1917 synthase